MPETLAIACACAAALATRSINDVCCAIALLNYVLRVSACVASLEVKVLSVTA